MRASAITYGELARTAGSNGLLSVAAPGRQ